MSTPSRVSLKPNPVVRLRLDTLELHFQRRRAVAPPRLFVILAKTLNSRGLCLAAASPAAECAGPLRLLPRGGLFWAPARVKLVEVGSLVTAEAAAWSSATQRPHQGDDIVVTGLVPVPDVERVDVRHLCEALAMRSLDDAWPRAMWREESRSILPDACVPSLCCVRGRVRRVHPREGRGPLVDCLAGGRPLTRIPFGPHRLFPDHGVQRLRKLQDVKADGVLLLGLARPFGGGQTAVACVVLLLGAFESASSPAPPCLGD